MKTIKEVTNNTAILRFVEHNNKKFKLTYDNPGLCNRKSA